MTRKLKTVGVALMAVFALSAVAASAAHAETGAITATQYPAWITGTQIKGNFNVGSGVREVTCAKTNYDATITGPTDPLELTPTFENCTAKPGSIPATVTHNGCTFTLKATKPGTTGQPANTGTLEATVDCPIVGGVQKQIEVHIYENATKHAENKPLCTYDIGPQVVGAAGIYHNVPTASPEDILATITANVATTSTIGSKILCGAAAGGAVGAAFESEVTIEGFKDEGGVEGARIGTMVG